MSNHYTAENNLCVKGLSCTRGNRELFSQLEFIVRSGEALIIQGENGSGKTSLLRMLASITLPEDGVIEWNQQDIRHNLLEFRQAIRYLGHQSAVKQELTVRENIRLLCALDADCQCNDVVQLATAVGLRKRLNVPCGKLSAGQKRRLGLTRLLIAPRTLWILDEPLTALDKGFIEEIEKWIEAHILNGGMVILSTHRALQLDSVKVRELCL